MAKTGKGTVSFILLTSFLNLVGIGIIGPVIPFVVERYVPAVEVATISSWLFTSFSLFQFIATPTLGALSDRFGRRPVLLVSLLGSAVGYFMLGIGGALWVLFAGRIIDGITGGNLATIYAYAADITEPKNRTKFFGQIGSVAGFGFVVGPALGGLAYSITGAVEAPFFLAGVLTLFITLLGYFVMPETLTEERREKSISLSRLNPLSQMMAVLQIPSLRLLLLGVFLWSVAFAVLPANLAVLAKDQLGWNPDGTGAIFTVVGLVGVITQGYIVGRLLPTFGEARLTIGGLTSMVIGFLLIALLPYTLSPVNIFVGTVFVAFGNALIIPTLTGLLSQGVSMREQGRIQGGNQSIQALGRVLGPLWGGWAYTVISHSAPYVSGALGLALAALTVFTSTRVFIKPKDVAKAGD